MLGPNAGFEFEGRSYRVILVRSLDEVWCIDVDGRTSWPVCFAMSEIELLPAVHLESAFRSEGELSPIEKKGKDEAWQILERLVRGDRAHQLFIPHFRKKAIQELIADLRSEAEQAKKLRGLRQELPTCTEPTLYKWLRRYWQRGMTPSAVIPDYQKCGRVVRSVGSAPVVGFTSGRGRPSARDIKTYQVTEGDQANMRAAIEWMAKDRRRRLPDAHQEMLDSYYSTEDGNGVAVNRDEGEWPTFMQLRYFYWQNYDVAQRKIHRVGKKDFDLNEREKTGSAMTDVWRAGQCYEVDATVFECYAVTKATRSLIAGKPTLYLVIDRWSRLIVGYYLGFEKPSWIAAMQAILSVAEDKRALCRRYGVKYVESDWPAHQRFPQEFIADRGSDWLAGDSSKIVQELGSTLVNLPAGRADMKGVVESAIKSVLLSCRKFEPSSDPDANQKARQKVPYKKRASATIDELNKYVIEIIIQRNRKTVKGFPMTPEMIGEHMKPSPINLWNYSVRTGGVANLIREETVRRALLPSVRATVTDGGIQVGPLSYWSEQASREGWFTEAKGKSFKVDVSIDPRNVDAIYVHARDGKKGASHVAQLWEKSIQYKGLSRKEVDHLERLKTQIHGDGAHEDRLDDQRFRREVGAVAARAEAEMRAESRGMSATARSKNSKEDWEIELYKERQKTLVVDNEAVPATLQTDANPTAHAIPITSGALAAPPADIAADRVTSTAQPKSAERVTRTPAPTSIVRAFPLSKAASLAEKLARNEANMRNRLAGSASSTGASETTGGSSE